MLFTSPLTFGRLWPTVGLSLSPISFADSGEGEGELPRGSSEGGEVISDIVLKTQ
jgi:hypothetical protein